MLLRRQRSQLAGIRCTRGIEPDVGKLRCTCLSKLTLDQLDEVTIICRIHSRSDGRKDPRVQGCRSYARGRGAGSAEPRHAVRELPSVTGVAGPVHGVARRGWAPAYRTTHRRTSARLFRIERRAVAAIRARRCQRICTRFRGQEQILDVGLRLPPQSPPLVDRHQHAGLAPLRHDLRSVGEASSPELTDLARLGSLYLPRPAHLFLTQPC